jgi:hypothetical protein
VEGPDIGERIEKAKKIKEKEEKEKEKEKEGKGDKGSSGRPGSWSEGGSWRPAFRGSVIIMECMDILQDIVDWGRDKELEGSKIVVTPVESGDTLQEVAPILPLEAQGGWEQECSISIKDTEGVGSNGGQGQGQGQQGQGQ